MAKLPYVESAETTAIRDLMTPLLRQDLDHAIEGLSEKERGIFTSHFLDGVPYADLAREWGVKEKRVGRIIANAKNHLQGVTSLRQYLDMI